MSESALAAGSLIGGRYRLEHHLGEGGMGTVWSAIHTVTHRAVAMKFLSDSVRERPELRQRFLREASAASALKHPNVVEILDVFDFADASPVMVMELLRGETLGSKLARDQRLGMEETAALLMPVVSAVGTAHSLGIVHRDLKPENLFLEETSGDLRVKVLDFGIAKLTAEYYSTRGMSAMLTDAGSMLGTPYYMAPEQASGERTVDHRADVWSLGVILYECLSGTRPIEGDNLTQVVSRLMTAGIIPLERLAPQLPHDVTALVMQMLSRDPARRPDGLQPVKTVLGRYSRTEPPDFGAPSTDRQSLLPHPPIPPPSPVKSASGSADPRGPTMLSAPPVDNSVRTMHHALPAERRKVPGVVYAAAGAVAFGVLWFAFARSSSTPTTDKGHELSTLSAAGAPLVVQPPQASADAAPTASGVEKPNKASTQTVRPKATEKPRATTPATPQRPPPATDDGSSLFHGRK